MDKGYELPIGVAVLGETDKTAKWYEDLKRDEPYFQNDK